MSVSLSTSSLNNENTLERECLTAFVQASAKEQSGLFALPQIIQEFRCGLDSSNQQMTARPRTGHVKQMTLGVADRFEIGVIDAGFNALPERDHFVVACHHLTARDFSPA